MKKFIGGSSARKAELNVFPVYVVDCKYTEITAELVSGKQPLIHALVYVDSR